MGEKNVSKYGPQAQRNPRAEHRSVTSARHITPSLKERQYTAATHSLTPYYLSNPMALEIFTLTIRQLLKTAPQPTKLDVASG